MLHLGLSYLSVLALFVNAEHAIHVDISQGTIKGAIETSRGGREFFAFYGIPYAEPPLGNFRFENPVPPKPWQGVKDCTILPSPCLSYEENQIFGQEDCLYLNLYTPKLANDVDSPLPVMLFVYGGAFMYGNALPGRYGPHYFMDKDVIVITFHYRLGVLGYLSTEDSALPGNYGFKDFAAVLKWIQENVHSFNGDKNKVTIAGGSSGGQTVGYALMSPLTKGLFHRCISQSGFPMGILPQGVARKRAWKVAKNVGCGGDGSFDSKDMVSCLKQVPAAKLIKENYSFYVFGSIIPAAFGPVIEAEEIAGAFLVDNTEKLLSRNSEIPWIIGINSNEGGMSTIFVYFGHDKSLPQKLADNYEKYFPMFLNTYGITEEIMKKVADKMKKYFFAQTDITTNAIGFSKMISTLYLVSLRKTLDLYRGPKYVYYYDHRNIESFSKMYGDPPAELDLGVIHGDELISTFNWSDVIKPVTQGIDLTVSEQILDLWSNFIRFGDPNGKKEKQWIPCNNLSRIDYLHVKNGKLQMRGELLKKEYEFIDELYLLI